MKRVFISYRREDTKDWVHSLYQWLSKLLPDKVFLDIDGIAPSYNFRATLERELTTCHAALVVIGPDWLGTDPASGQRRIDNTGDPGDFVRLEVERLLARQIPIIPVLVRGARMPAGYELPASLAGLSDLQAVAVEGDQGGGYPQAIVSALLRVLRRWQASEIRTAGEGALLSHTWCDASSLTENEYWLCGAISAGGGGGHVGYGILLRTVDGGVTWHPATNIDSGRGEFRWGGYRYNWTEVGPIYEVLLYSRQRDEAQEIVNGYLATATGIYRATAARTDFAHTVQWRRTSPDPDQPVQVENLYGRSQLVPLALFGSLASLEGDNELYAAGWPGIANWIRNGQWILQMPSFTYDVGMVAVAGGSDNRSVWAVGRACGNPAKPDAYGNWGSYSHGALFHLQWPSNRWEQVPLPGIELEERQSLRGVHVEDQAHVYAVGDSGLVIKGVREKGGTWNWSRLKVPTEQSLRRCVRNRLGLWAIGNGGTILNSLDDGANWTALDVPGVEAELNNLRFFESTGWILGHKVVLRLAL